MKGVGSDDHFEMAPLHTQGRLSRARAAVAFEGSVLILPPHSPSAFPSSGSFLQALAGIRGLTFPHEDCRP